MPLSPETGVPPGGPALHRGQALRAGRRQRTLWAGLGLLAAAAGGLPPAAAEDGPRPVPASTPADDLAEGALAALDAPFAAEREEGVRRLTEGLPGTRAAVLAAFRAAPPPRRALLARVLGADPGDEAELALLGALSKSTDVLETRAIRTALVSRGPAALVAAKAFLSAPGAGPSARAELSALAWYAQRDRVEALFLAKKSRSGATGFYRGQFEDLRPEREMALEVLSHIVMNRVMRSPGVFPAGSYRFVHAPNFLVEPGELRDIAANGLSELAPKDPADPTSVDDETLAMLSAMAEDLEVAAGTDHARQAARARKKPARRWGLVPAPSEEDDLMNVVLVTLALARPDSDWPRQVESRVRFYKGLGLLDSAAMLYMRMGEYERAIDFYSNEIDNARSIVLPYYNIACAHAKWSEDLKDKDPRESARHRRMAMRSLEQSVEAGYPDWPWMEQDRDLDAIRKEPAYARLLAKMKAEFSPEAVKKALGGGGVGESGESIPAPPGRPPLPPPRPGPAMGR